MHLTEWCGITALSLPLAADRTAAVAKLIFTSRMMGRLTALQVEQALIAALQAGPELLPTKH